MYTSSILTISDQKWLKCWFHSEILISSEHMSAEMVISHKGSTSYYNQHGYHYQTVKAEGL